MKTKKLPLITLLVSISLTWITCTSNAVIFVSNFDDTDVSPENVILEALPEVDYNTWRAQKFTPSTSGNIDTVTILGHEEASGTDVESYLEVHLCPAASATLPAAPTSFSGCTSFPTLSSGSPFQTITPSTINGQAPSANITKYITYTGGSHAVVSGTSYWVVVSVPYATASSKDFIWRCTCGSASGGLNANCGTFPTNYDAAPNTDAVNWRQATASVTGSDPGTANWSGSNTEAFYIKLEGTPIPEPSTYAAIFSLAALVGVMVVRSRRK